MEATFRGNYDKVNITPVVKVTLCNEHTMLEIFNMGEQRECFQPRVQIQLANFFCLLENY